MEDKSQVFTNITQHTLLYGVGAALNGLVGFILIPLLTRYIVPEEYGAYALMEVGLQSLLVLYGLGFNVSVIKGYSSAVSIEEKNQLVNNVLIFSVITSFIISIVVIVLSEPLSRSLFSEVPKEFVIYSVLIVFFESIWALFLTVFRAEQNLAKFLMASFLQVSLVALAMIIFIVGFGEKVEGIFKGRLIGDILVCGVLFITHRKRFSFYYSWDKIRTLLAYGLPVLPSGLAIMWINLSGRIFLNKFSSIGEVGIYAISQKLAGIASLLIIQPFGTAWLPIMFGVEKRHDAPSIYARVLTYYSLCSAFCFLMLTIFSPELFLILTGESYQSGIALFPILILSLLVYGLFYPLSVGIFIKSQNRVLPYVYGAGIIINLFLNYQLIPLYGASGTAFSMLFSFLFISVAQGVISDKFYPIPIEYSRLIKILLLSVFVYLASRPFTASALQYLFLRAVILILFPVSLYGVAFFTKQELDKARCFLRRVKVGLLFGTQALLKVFRIS